MWLPDCTDDEKYKIIGRATSLLVVEAIPSSRIASKIVKEGDQFKKEIYELFEVLTIGGGFGVISTFANELKKPELLCK